MFQQSGAMKRMRDLDAAAIEAIIRLPFFYRLEKERPKPETFESGTMREITFRCNKILPNGMYGLLDEEFENEFVVRYKIIEFKQ